MSNNTTEQTPEAVTQINNSLSEILTFVKQTGTAAIDFSKEQIPLYVQELLAYDYTISLIYFVIGVILLGIICPICAYWWYSFTKPENLIPYGYDYKKTSDMILVPIICCFLSLIIGFCITTSNLDWFKIKMAPRVYIVEKIRHLTR